MGGQYKSIIRVLSIAISKMVNAMEKLYSLRMMELIILMILKTAKNMVKKTNFMGTEINAMNLICKMGKEADYVFHLKKTGKNMLNLK